MTCVVVHNWQNAKIVRSVCHQFWIGGERKRGVLFCFSQKLVPLCRQVSVLTLVEIWLVMSASASFYVTLIHQVFVEQDEVMVQTSDVRASACFSDEVELRLPQITDVYKEIGRSAVRDMLEELSLEWF